MKHKILLLLILLSLSAIAVLSEGKITSGIECVDNPCSDGYYCDIPDKGQCKPMESIQLIIDEPAEAVTFHSCNVNNEIEVKAHIENPPPNAHLDSYHATIDGQRSELVECRPDFEKESAYICAITIPGLPDCRPSSAYTYRPNSLTFSVTFDDGYDVGIKTMEARLPKITLNGTGDVDTAAESVRDIEKVGRDLEAVQKGLDNAIERCETGKKKDIMSAGTQFISRAWSGLSDFFGIKLPKGSLDFAGRAADWLSGIFKGTGEKPAAGMVIGMTGLSADTGYSEGPSEFTDGGTGPAEEEPSPRPKCSDTGGTCKPDVMHCIGSCGAQGKTGICDLSGLYEGCACCCNCIERPEEKNQLKKKSGKVKKH
jgi:hypothetical protein